MSGDTSAASYGTIRPSPNEPPCRHTCNLRFMFAMIVPDTW